MGPSDPKIRLMHFLKADRPDLLNTSWLHFVIFPPSAKAITSLKISIGEWQGWRFYWLSSTGEDHLTCERANRPPDRLPTQLLQHLHHAGDR